MKEIPLDEWENPIPRKTITLFLFLFIIVPTFIILGFITGIFKSFGYAVNEFLIPCWNGPNNGIDGRPEEVESK